jgi:hypothetical protein
MEQERRKKEEEDRQKELEHQKKLEIRKRYKKRPHIVAAVIPKAMESVPPPPKKPSVNNKEILANQKKREEAYFAKLLQHRKKLEKEEQDKQQRLEKLRQKVKVVVERDPSRLLQPTQGMLHKLIPNETHSSIGGMVTFQKRMVPEWRIGCN